MRKGQKLRTLNKKLTAHYLLLIAVFLMVGVPLLAQAPEPPLPLYALPDPSTRFWSSSSMALTFDGRTLVAANALNNTASIVQITQSQVRAEIPVGTDPRAVAVTQDDTRALVVNRGDGTLSVINLGDRTASSTIPVGVLPYAVVPGRDGLAYVSVQGSDEVAVVNIDAGRVIARIPTPDSPAGLTLWGDFLYVTHLWSGQFSLIYLPQRKVIDTISTGPDISLSQSIEIDRRRGIAYLPQTRSNAGDSVLTFDTTAFPVVNVLKLADLSLQRSARLTLDTVDRPVNMPFAALFDSARQWLYVANAGSNDVSVVNLQTGTLSAHIEVGANPRALLFSRDGGAVYVHNMLDGTISVIDTRSLRVTDVVPISNLRIPIDVLIGAQLFHSAADPRLSKSRWISCATCHFDGQPDGRTWQGISGGRNTPPLYNLLDTPPYNWDGDWDELADVEVKIRELMAGRGLVDGEVYPADGNLHAGLSLDLDTLTAYLTTLQGPMNPTQADAGQIERGAAVFEAQGCMECHSGASGTDLQRHDVGTGGEFDTPTLRWLWLSAPYFHDGSAAALRDVFLRPGAHLLFEKAALDDIDALVVYLLSLP